MATVMDFRYLCQKIDVDSIRARMPNIPAMPNIKLPKSMSKLKSRKIFRSSRENVNGNAMESPSKQIETAGSLQQLPPAIPPADFIDHTPQHISTISSLLHERDSASYRSTYRSAHSVDDDYPSPRQYNRRAPLKPISPIRSIDIPKAHSFPENENTRFSLVEKLQKSYKDVTDFRLKHIFVKKTVVRKDNIEVDHYVQSYQEERLRDAQDEQTRQQRERIEDYRFNFKVSRQKSGHSYSLSSNESPTRQFSPTASEIQANKSDEESDIERTPPPRKPGIAATRFSKVRNPPLSMPNDNVENQKLEEEELEIERNASTLWAIKERHTPVKQDINRPIKGNTYKERMHRLTSYVPSSLDESDADTPAEKVKTRRKATTKIGGEERKRKAPLTPQESKESIEQHENEPKTENTLDVIKHNIKRFHKSIKRPQQSIDETEEEEGNKEQKRRTRTEKITAHLRKYKSTNASMENVGNDNPNKEENSRSPIRSAINKKIQTWKRSLKKRPSEGDTQTGDETTPEKTTRTGTLIKKLRHIRTRKHPNTTDDMDENEIGDNVVKQAEATRKIGNLEEKFEKARKNTLKKVNEKMQHIKFFHKSQDNVTTNTEESNIKNKSNYTDEETDDEEDELQHTILQDVNHRAMDNREDITSIGSLQPLAMWTNKPINSSPTETDSEDGEYPRVLIHQDNTNDYESTLIIAVTRSPIPRSAPGPVISEILPTTETILDNEDVTQTSVRTSSIESLTTSVGHTRKLSMDSNSDSDNWIPENMRNLKVSQSKEGSRRASSVGLLSINEYEEPWLVRTPVADDKLYKTKSIDIFEKSNITGGVSTAFEDFDEALKDEPIMKIQRCKALSFERESSEDTDAADDDNSSRVTKILAVSKRDINLELSPRVQSTNIISETSVQQTNMFGNSSESLIGHIDEKDEVNTDDEDDYDDEDRPPSAAPSPPPSISPPPPPLPERRTTNPLNSLVSEACLQPPTLPQSKPPVVPPIIPERNASMSRISKPLVKTSSLRLAYSEQVNPDDVGKVNKLISRFEHPKAQQQSLRPRVIARKIFNKNSEDYSEEEGTSSSSSEKDEVKLPNDNTKRQPKQCEQIKNIEEHDMTNAVKIVLVPTVTDECKKQQNKMKFTLKDEKNNIKDIPIQSDSFSSYSIPKSMTNLDRNSNTSSSFNSNINSEYGSPLEYPSSLMGSTETTPIPLRKQDTNSRNRRSMTRDDDVYHSFESDEGRHL